MTLARKEEHVRLAVNENVGFKNRTTGLEHVELPYNALPEINLDDVLVSTDFVGKPLRMPLVITGMTGGYPDATRINVGLAQCAVELGIAFGVGSMRSAIENKNMRSSFSVVQHASAYIPVISNIGAVQLVQWSRNGELADRIAEVADMVSASVFGIHINALQEVMQPEGQPWYEGVTEAIAQTVECSPIPVLVKEVGAGIGGAAASRLIAAGVSIIDVGGAGGTSWAGVEIMRHQHPEPLMEFWDVGIPTAECIRQVVATRDHGNHPGTASTTQPRHGVTIIASGGINSGTHIAKAIALGADLCGSARPILQAFEHGGINEVAATVTSWELDLKRWMYLTGSANLDALAHCRSDKE